MPLFTASSPYDADVERATSELNAEDNVMLFRELADKIRHAPSPGARDFLRSIVKRINDKNPHVALQALSLLDTSVQRSGYAFHLEMAAPDFISECRTLIGSGKPHPKVVKKLKLLIKRWAENEFKTDKALSQMVSLYNGLKSEGHKFNFEDVNISAISSSTSSVSTKKEQDDLERAIALSLKESNVHSGVTSSLYPSATTSGGFYPNISSNAGPREPRKVRALYDFEAAEDNELTFKAGEIIGVLDDSDVNWWKGVSWRGEGLFPANFVTADLTIEPEPEIHKVRKSVHFHDEVQVKVVEASVPVLEVDEEKIDSALSLIQNSDPTDPESDSAELLSLEEQCKDMGPLIDQELVKVDREHNSLMESNTKLMEAFQMYHSLMRELPSYGYAPNVASAPQTMYANQQYSTMMSGQGPQHTIPSGYGPQITNSSNAVTNENATVYHQSPNFVASQHSNTPTPPPIVQQTTIYNSQPQYMGGAYGAPATMNYIPSDGYAQSTVGSEAIQSMSYTSAAQQPITAQSLL